MKIYSYQVQDGIVIDGTVSDGTCAAEWLMEVKGGFWVDTETPAWIGGTWDEINGFQPPAPPAE